MAIKILRNISQLFRDKTIKDDDATEGLKEQRELLKVTMKDEDLAREIDKDIENSIGLHTQIKGIQQENEDYYLGEQLDKKKFFGWELPSAENLLYMAVETILSIITSRRREPIVLAAQDTDDSKELKEKTQQFLTWKWDIENMMIKFEDWVRHSLLYRIGVLKIRWDIEKDDFEINVIRPQRIIIDKDATDEYDSKFIAEYKQDTLADLVEMFPKAKQELIELYDNKMGSIVKYVEYWQNEFVVWKVDKIILDKKKNPNWNWDEKDRKESLKKLRERWIEKTKNEKLDNILLNYFNEPRKPFIIVSLKSLGNSIYADSVTPDTPILIRRYGKFLDIIPIEELSPNYKKSYQGYWEKYRHIDQNIEVITKEGKWSKISYVYRHKVNKPIYTIEIGGGIAKVTGDHSLFQSGEEIKVKDLKLKDKIDTLDFNYKNEFSEITKDNAYALGFFVAEGWTNGVKYGFRNNDWNLSQKTPEVLEKIGNILEKVWHQTFVVKKQKDEMYILTSVGKKEDLVNWYRKHCYTRSGEKRVPISILNSNKEIKRAFLEGYWKGDGNGKISEGVGRCLTKSFVLASGIYYLLNCLEYEIGVSSDKVKKSIFNLNIIRTTRRKEKNEVKYISHKNNNDFVYDIETVNESHSFVGGVGNIIFHNTSDFEQGKVIQDIINKIKRRINEAGVRALGREIYSGSYISKEEAKKAISNPTNPMWLEKGRAGDGVGFISPQPVSPVLFQDLQDTKLALDNVMGTHGTTRGEQGPQETARGRTILREGDLGRIDLMSRRIDKKVELLYGWMLQMAKVYYTEDHFTKMLGSEGATAYLQYSQNDIEDGQEIVVKSELTVDKATQRQNIIQRMEAGLLDPLSYFEKFDETNPKEKARRLVFYNTDPKLYVQQFCVDEQTEGTENDPVMKAKQEQKAMMEGKEVPPFARADKLHLDEHGKFIKGSEFVNLDDVEIKQNFQDHIQGELDILRGQRQTV